MGSLNDFMLSGIAVTSGYTGNNKISASSNGRIMGLLLAATADMTFEAEDAATFTSADVTFRCLANESRYVDFSPYGWRVTAISTQITGAGSSKIFYIVDD